MKSDALILSIFTQLVDFQKFSNNFINRILFIRIIYRILVLLSTFLSTRPNFPRVVQNKNKIKSSLDTRSTILKNHPFDEPFHRERRKEREKGARKKRSEYPFRVSFKEQKSGSRRARSIETLLNRGEFMNGVRSERRKQRAALVAAAAGGGNQSEKGSERSGDPARLICNENVSAGSKREREREAPD